MNQDILRSYGSVVAELGHLLQEGVIFNAEEVAALDNLTTHATRIINDLDAPKPSNNRPLEISLSEWQEIMQVPEVHDGWGLNNDESPEQVAEMIYGVKFHYITDGPGYAGDLYILQGGALGEPPLMLTRTKGKLLVVFPE
jgi:hypothetical protein